MPTVDALPRRVRRVLRRNAGRSGLVLDVRWPVTYQRLPAMTESVRCRELGWLRGKPVWRHRLQPRRVVFAPRSAGRYRFELTSRGMKGREDETEVTTRLTHDGPVLITAWPAKRRILTPARASTEWVVTPWSALQSRVG